MDKIKLLAARSIDMNVLTKPLSVLVQLLLVLCFTVSSGEAKIWTLQSVDVNDTTSATIDDAPTLLAGLNSFTVDGVERVFQQRFWYRVGPTGSETSIDKLPLKVVTPPQLNPYQPTLSSLLITYTLAGQFDISVLYELTPALPEVGKASLKKSVTIKNIASTDLDFHLFEYSDYDLSDTGLDVGDADNIEVFNNKVYQNGSQSVGGFTFTHESSLPPSKFDIDDGSGAVKGFLLDEFPSDFFNPQTPYSYGSDKQFVKQWDLAIPAGPPVSFSITDRFYPTLPVTASKTHEGCATYQGQVDYTIGFDNLANIEELTNLKIIDFLPGNTTPATISNGGVPDPTTNTVTWSLPSLAAGADQKTEQLSITVNSSTDITNELLLVSDQAFPTRISDFAALCNHPPAMNFISNETTNEGEAFSTKVAANDLDSELVYALSGAPAGMTISSAISSAGLINYPVGIAGTYVITVTVTDVGSLSASRTFTLTVVKPNTPPVITSTSSPVTTSTLPTRSKGDLDGNGKEDVADALLALQFAVGLKNTTATDMAFGDVAPFVNGKSAPDGVINVADALAFLQKTVGMLNW